MYTLMVKETCGTLGTSFPTFAHAACNAIDFYHLCVIANDKVASKLVFSFGTYQGGNGWHHIGDFNIGYLISQHHYYQRLILMWNRDRKEPIHNWMKEGF